MFSGTGEISTLSVPLKSNHKILTKILKKLSVYNKRKIKIICKVT